MVSLQGALPRETGLLERPKGYWVLPSLLGKGQILPNWPAFCVQGRVICEVISELRPHANNLKQDRRNRSRNKLSSRQSAARRDPRLLLGAQWGETSE